MSPVAALPLLFFLSVSFHPSAAGSEVPATTDNGNGSPCPVSRDGYEFCPVKCFRSDPVCGDNGQTYWCGCPDAACAAVRAVKNGPCELGNGGTALVSAQAFLLIHILWLIVLGFSVLCGFF